MNIYRWKGTKFTGSISFLSYCMSSLEFKMEMKIDFNLSEDILLIKEISCQSHASLVLQMCAKNKTHWTKSLT